MVVEHAQIKRSKVSLEGAPERDSNLERREQILSDSWKVLAQVGFEKITTRRIAEAAGINIATLHYYFGSKEAVLMETLRFAKRWTEKTMRDALVDAKTSSEMMERAFSMLRNLMLLRPGVLRFDLAVRAFRDPEAKREADSLYKTYRRFFEEIFERHLEEGGGIAQGLTVDSLAEYTVAVLDGVTLHHTLSNDDVAGERNLGIVKKQILELLTTPRGAVPETD